MTIAEVYNKIVYIVRKERNGFVSIDDFNQMIPLAQTDTFNHYYDISVADQEIHDALSPFKTYYDFTPSLSPNGVVTMPSNYSHLINGYTITSGSQRQVTFPEEDEMVNAKNSKLRPVSINNPLGEEIRPGVIQLTPEQGQTGRMWYLREPNTPIYAFTLNGRIITYDSINSVQLDFFNVYQNMVIFKSLPYFGVNLSDEQAVQYGLLKANETK